MLSELVLDLLLDELFLLFVALEDSLIVSTFDRLLNVLSIELDSLVLLEGSFSSLVDNNVFSDSLILRLLSSLDELLLLLSSFSSTSDWFFSDFEFSDTSAITSFFKLVLVFSSTEVIDSGSFFKLGELLLESFALNKTLSLFFSEILLF